MAGPPAPPGLDVLRAFGVADRPVERLGGGRGLTWRAGDVVLRPSGDPLEARWRSATMARLVHTARHQPAVDAVVQRTAGTLEAS